MSKQRFDGEVDEWLTSIPNKTARKSYCKTIFNFAPTPAEAVSRPRNGVKKFAVARIIEMNRAKLTPSMMRLSVAATPHARRPEPPKVVADDLLVPKATCQVCGKSTLMVPAPFEVWVSCPM